MDSKSPWYSKTVWFGVITGVASAITPLVPGAQEQVANALPVVGVAWGILAIVLRMISKDKIKLGE